MLLVTGATGTNGSEVIRQLRAAGAEVRALVHNRAKAADLEALGAEIAEGDFGDAASLAAAMQGVDRALLVPPFHPEHTTMTASFVEAAKQAGLERIVKLSAMGAAVDSPVDLLRWHEESERQIRDSGVACTFLRPNSFMQNMLAFAPLIAGQGQFYVPVADARVSHIDARDIAAVAARTLMESGHEGAVYELTGPESLTFSDVANTLSEVAGKPVQYVPITPEQFKETGLQWGMPEWMLDSMNDLYAFYRAGNGGEVTDTVQQITGRAPRSFRQFAEDHAAAWSPK